MSFGALFAGAVAVDGTRRFAHMVHSLVYIGVILAAIAGPPLILYNSVSAGVSTGFWWLLPIPFAMLALAVRALHRRRWGSALGFYLASVALALAVSIPSIRVLSERGAEATHGAALAWDVLEVKRYGQSYLPIWPGEMRAWIEGINVQQGQSFMPQDPENYLEALRETHGARKERVIAEPRDALLSYDDLAATYGDWLRFHKTCIIGNMPLLVCSDEARRQAEFGIKLEVEMARLVRDGNLANCGEHTLCSALSNRLERHR